MSTAASTAILAVIMVAMSARISVSKDAGSGGPTAIRVAQTEWPLSASGLASRPPSKAPCSHQTSLPSRRISVRCATRPVAKVSPDARRPMHRISQPM